VRVAQDDREYRWALVNWICAGYGGECACCGEDEPMFLTIDHVNGNGAEERRVYKGGHTSAFLRMIIDEGFPDRYQLLCWNCNCGRHRNGGVCPHQAV
jgi:hypothetical protein